MATIGRVLAFFRQPAPEITHDLIGTILMLQEKFAWN
jgi:hypothetical protein